MATESRSGYHHYLQTRLSDIEWCMDGGAFSARETFLRALSMQGDDAAVHLEDDVILTKNFQQKITSVIEQHHNSVIQFFSMRKADMVIGSRWESGRTFMMNQCFYLPCQMASEMIEASRTWEGWKTHPNGYDLFMADFMKMRKIRYFLHVPSLVQHRIGKSLIDARRSSRRISLTFCDADE